VKVYVGGLPQQPEPPLNYQIVYSLEGALDYYTTPSWVLRGGKPVLSRSARFGYGRHAFAFRPRKRGAVAVHLRAVDLAGNVGAVAGRIVVRKVG